MDARLHDSVDYYTSAMIILNPADPMTQGTAIEEDTDELAPALQLAAQHVLNIQLQSELRTVPLEAATYSIGRHPGNSIVLNVNTISGQHAILLRIYDPSSGQSFFRIIDGDLQGKRSRNGLWVNGNRCIAHDLKDQDVIRFGPEVQATYQSSPVFAPEADRVVDATATLAVTTYNFSLHRQMSDEELKNLSDVALVRLSSFIELIPYPIFELNLHGKLTYLNPAAIEQFPTLQQAKSHPLLEGLHILSRNEPGKYCQREVIVGDRIFQQSIHFLIESDLIRCYLVDITQRKFAERQLRESEERYAAAAIGANDGLWDWNLLTHSIYYSPRWKSMIGYGEPEISDRPDEWLNRIHPDDRAEFDASLYAHLAGTTAHFENEFRLSNKNGDFRWYRSRGLAMRNDQQAPYRLAGSLTDIDAYYRTKQQLLHDTLHDAMTGLPNRNLFIDRLNQALIKNQRYPQQHCAILFLDLDRFKVVNDSLGHLAGDQLLVKVSKRLLSCLREMDTVARFGGDEFVVLLEEVRDLGEVTAVAERIQLQMRDSFQLGAQEVFTGASIGIALSSNHYNHPEEMLRDADAAMYRAKKLGKGRYEVFSNEMYSQNLAILQIDSDLRRAIERQEFFLVYQPIVSLPDRCINGFEALIRWQHPERGMVSPAEFIPIAEETGFIVPLGEWVLTEACQQMRRWQAEFQIQHPFTVSVNVSSNQFAQANLVRQIQYILENSGIHHGSLKLEITEGVIMRHEDSISNTLSALKELGIQLGIDDFGTGYSSLKYLNSFPVDALKIDRSFVQKMHQNEGLEIVKTIINLAHNLGMDLVAEGVETSVQAAKLQTMDCEYGQGYFFSKPLAKTRVNALLGEGVGYIPQAWLQEH